MIKIKNKFKYKKLKEIKKKVMENETLECRVIIEELDINFVIFEINISRKYLKEVNDALKCERLYNDTEFDFGKLIYKNE